MILRSYIECWGATRFCIWSTIVFIIDKRYNISDDLVAMARRFAGDTSLSFSSADLAKLEGFSKLGILAKMCLTKATILNPQKTEVTVSSNNHSDYSKN